MNEIRKMLQEQTGSAIVLLALAFTVLAGASGMVVDVGAAYIEKNALQNALDAAVLAAAQELPDTAAARNMAIEYAEKNGVTLSPADITFENGNKRIRISHTDSQENYFLKLFNIDFFDINARAGAEMGGAHPIFDYALFSGSTTEQLFINGGGWTIQGSVHTNDRFYNNSGGFTITGGLEACDGIRVDGGSYYINGGQYPAAAYEAMPDLSAQIEEAAAAAGKEYDVANYYINAWEYPKMIAVDQPIYVHGNVWVNGGGWSGNGAIMADGNITINGGGLNVQGSNEVCFYSKNGNITFTGGGATFRGVLYAPNGTITITGGSTYIYGSVVANKVFLDGGAINIYRDSVDITSLPGSGTRLVL
ncbi:MAG: pilus assembly protein TadG-related protein [Clostridia bacterium]|nr:pilus assembly protein TadG-related protein [Clostridia bacterium]